MGGWVGRWVIVGDEREGRQRGERREGVGGWVGDCGRWKGGTTGGRERGKDGVLTEQHLPPVLAQDVGGRPGIRALEGVLLLPSSPLLLLLLLGPGVAVAEAFLAFQVGVFQAAFAIQGNVACVDGERGWVGWGSVGGWVGGWVRYLV